MIPCRICDDGELLMKSKFRLSGCIVAIGFFILIPSLLGVLVGGVGLVMTGDATVETLEATEEEVRADLRNAGVPGTYVQQILDLEDLSPEQMKSLNSEQRRAVHEAKLTLTASTAGVGIGAAIAGGASIFYIIASLIGVLVGWLLVMRKKVLQCTNCGSVTPAS